MIKLEIEMIPSTNFYNNVRSAVTTQQWDILRKNCYEKAGYICEICAQNGLQQGYKHRVEAHEIWEYDFNKNIQKLNGLVSLCPRCHMAKHIGRAFAIGKQAEVFQHIQYVNNWDHKQLVNYLGGVFMEHRIRSQQIWTLDLSYLTEEYGVKKFNLEKAAKAKPKTTYYYKQTKKKKNVKKTPKKKGGD